MIGIAEAERAIFLAVRLGFEKLSWAHPNLPRDICLKAQLLPVPNSGGESRSILRFRPSQRPSRRNIDTISWWVILSLGEISTHQIYFDKMCWNWVHNFYEKSKKAQKNFFCNYGWNFIISQVMHHSVVCYFSSLFSPVSSEWDYGTVHSIYVRMLLLFLWKMKRRRMSWLSWLSLPIHGCFKEGFIVTREWRRLS